MMTMLIRRAFVALLMVALVGIAPTVAPRMSDAAGLTVSAIELESAPCDPGVLFALSKSVTHGKDKMATCATGFGCALTNFVAPKALAGAVRLAASEGVHWRIAKFEAGLAIAPDIRPPIHVI